MPRALLALVVLAVGLVPALASAGPRADDGPTGWLTYAYERPRTLNSGDTDTELCAQDLASGRQVRLLTHQQGRRVRLLTHEQATQPTWSPDGTQFAYTRWVADPFVGNQGFFTVYLARNGVDGGTQLLHNGQDFRSQPAWSPDGTKIAFRGDSDTIQVLDLKSGVLTRVTDAGFRGVAGSPSWSPDGRRLAFYATVGGPVGSHTDVLVYDFEQRTTTDITPDLESERDPAWSPDGGAIAFSAFHDGRLPSIDVVGADGSGRRALTDPGRFDPHDPAWSPDGRWIAFVRGAAIDAVSAQGGDERAIITTPFVKDAPAWVPPGTTPLPVDPAPCALSGTEGPDRITGTAYDDVIYGRGGGDVVNGGGGDDVIFGGPGDDELDGSTGKDAIDGESGRDRIYGGLDNDILSGSTGNDLLSGGDGNDRISGGQGRDSLYGNGGQDRMSSVDGQRDLVDGGPGLDTGPVERGLDRVLSVEKR